MERVDFGVAENEARDTLTPEELAAIAAFPADKVQKIPTGVSGNPFEYKWIPSKKNPRFDEDAGGGLRLVHKHNGKQLTEKERRAAKAKAGLQTMKKRRTAHSSRSSETMRRTLHESQYFIDRMAVYNEKMGRTREAVDDGARSYAEIAKRVGCAPGTVGTYLKRLGIDLAAIKRAESGFGPSGKPITENALRVKAAVENGHLRAAEIAEVTGLSTSSVHKNLRRLGISLLELQKKERGDGVY